MTYRVVQWATGAMGKAVLRSMIDHPGVEVVGVYVYGASKVGRDAGELANRPLTGVLATDDVDAILALDADVVVHAGRLGPYGSHDDDLVRILASGTNVISINGYSHPEHWGGERLARLQEACTTGGTSLMGAGLNPGFIAEQVATLASGLCLSIDNIEIVEAADASEVRDPAYLFDALGFGADPATVDPNDLSWGPVSSLNGMYEEALAAVALRLGMTLERVETDHVVHATPRDLEVPAGVIPAGTIGHTNWRWHAIVDGERRLTMSIHWYVDRSHLDDAEPPLWQVKVTGHPGVRIAIDLVKHPEDLSRMGAEQYALAGQVINGLPHVVAAEPGVLTRPLVTPFRADYA
ncbi:dihydrodipicolinate reductase [Pimelobacter simplex]|uniref:dihydrodipicolinate reductase n=1 Tax=Nocardioides simplex TaxID=2045 RepID=UPI003AAB1A83